MLGCLIGDFCGSIYERGPAYNGAPLGEGNCCFTDDSILTFATAKCLLEGKTNAEDFARAYIEWYRDYPDRGFGRGFAAWARRGELVLNGSAGNGSAMRVSPVGWTAKSLDEALSLAEKSAFYTHGHPEGIKGAQAVACSIFLLRQGASNDELKSAIESRFHYDLRRGVAQIIADGCFFDATCAGSVPQAITCFLEAKSFEDAILNALSLDADADTQAAIAASLAQIRFKIPEKLKSLVLSVMDEPMEKIFRDFEAKFYRSSVA